MCAVSGAVWNSFAQKPGIDFDWRITSEEVPLDQPSKYSMCLPATVQRRDRGAAPSPGTDRALKSTTAATFHLELTGNARIDAMMLDTS